MAHNVDTITTIMWTEIKPMLVTAYTEMYDEERKKPISMTRWNVV